MSFKSLKPQSQGKNIAQGVITVFYTPEFFALTLPFLSEEVDIEANISPSAILAISDSKAPEGIRSYPTAKIIEHMLVARNVSYNVVRIKEIASEEGSIAYRVVITLPQKGNTPLVIEGEGGDVILLTRKDAHGLDAVTVVAKDAPHYYKHLKYGERPATSDELKKAKCA